MSAAPASLILATLILAAVALASWLACGRVRTYLLRRQILDRPNARSLHEQPVPRGGGLGVVAVVLIAWLAVLLLNQAPGRLPLQDQGPLLLGALLLAAISWADDLKSRSATLRLAVQTLAVLLGLLALPDGAIFQGTLPPLLDRLVAALAWIWFVNLFNFMDGIDGISAVETISLGLGLAAVAWLGQGAGPLDAPILLPLILAAAMAGFLAWNWAPARLFLGDVGSVPLGYLLGWLLLSAAAAGFWAPALILPLYYLADSGITLARRLARGAKVWQAHREHFYQRAAALVGHAAVSLRILLANGILIALALLAVGGRLDAALALALAAVTVALLLARLGRAG